MRAFSSSADETWMPRGRVFAIFPKNDSIRLSQDPWVGVKVNFEAVR
jgi:hypothetical protein